MIQRIILTASCLLLLNSFAAAGNWPQWRGPSGDSTSDETGLPVSWSERAGIVWKVELPEWGTSTPAIWNDVVFVSTQAEEKLLLLRLEKKTGQVVWTREVGTCETPRKADKTEKRTGQKFHQLHNNASPSPVTDGEIVIAHFGDGKLAAYDYGGEKLWEHNLQAEHGTYTIWWGHANSPVIYGDLVINVCMQDSLGGVSEKLAPSYLVAYHKRTGKLAWKTMRMTEAEAEQCDSYTTPVLAQTRDRLELLVMGGNQVDAYDPTSGKQLWYLPGLTGGRTITGPALGHGMVYVTQGMRGNLLAVPLGGNGKVADKLVSWKYEANTPDSCCPVVAGKLLFTVSDNGIAQCFNATNGELHWKQRLGGNFKASPVAAEGRIYFLNMKGLCTVVAASQTYEKLAENQVDDETSASPAISDGRIYLRARKHLYCLEK